MEMLLALAGVAGVAFLLQSKSALPSEADYKKAKEKLVSNPDDPEVNLVAGKYAAFVLGDYPQALPMLAKSSDKTLKTLAEHELDPQYTDTAIKEIGMGDDWVSAAKDFKALHRTFYDRASAHYALAWKDVDGIWKDKLRERLRKLLTVPGSSGAPKKGPPTGWTADGQKIFVDSTVARRGGKSARLDGAKEKNVFGNNWITSPTMMVPKGPVMLSGWSASDGTENLKDQIVVNFYNQNGNFITNGGPFLLIDSPFWNRFDVKLDVPKDTARMSVSVLFFSTQGTLWLDDVSLKSADGKELLENGSFEK